VATTAARLTVASLDTWLARYHNLHLDLGTGDGAFAFALARSCPETGVLGLDTCLDNLTKPARRGRENLRFLTGDATDPPAWLQGQATALSINFPYGSLLRALIGENPAPRDQILALARPGARIAIRINASAALVQGIPIELARERLARAFGDVALSTVPATALRAFPSTWAKRIGYGRPSTLLVAEATRVG
jgi:16S rRNA (adenine(1408)-N(1))-methyltransferase